MTSLNYFNSQYNNYIFNQIPTNIIQIQNKSNLENNIIKNKLPTKSKIHNKSISISNYSNNVNFHTTNNSLLKKNKSQTKMIIKKPLNNKNTIYKNKINQNKFQTIGEQINKNKNCHTPDTKKKNEQKTIDYSNISENNKIFKKFNMTNNKKTKLSRPRTPDYHSYNSTSSNSNNRKNSKNKRKKTPEKMLNKMKFNLNDNFIGNNFEKKSPIKNKKKNIKVTNNNIYQKYKNHIRTISSNEKKNYTSNNTFRQNITNENNNIKNIKRHNRNSSALLNSNNSHINKSNSGKNIYSHQKKNYSEVNNLIKTHYNNSNHETPHFNNLNKNITKNQNINNNINKNNNKIPYTNIGIHKKNNGDFYQSFGNMIPINSNGQNFSMRNENKKSVKNNFELNNICEKTHSQRNIINNKNKNSRHKNLNVFKTSQTSKEKKNNKIVNYNNQTNIKKQINKTPKYTNPNYQNLNIQNHLTHMISNTQNIPNNYNNLFSMSLNSNKNNDVFNEQEKIDFNELDQFSPPFKQETQINVNNYNQCFYSPQINKYTNIELSKNLNSNINKQIIDDFIKKIPK